jgi:hypothetical protein
MIEAYHSQQKHLLPRQRTLLPRWETLCARFLPINDGNSIWRYSRQLTPDDPQQGWKIHISATILTANRVLEKVAPFLNEQKILFKAPNALHELSRLNCGLYYGFSQVGKCMTVYPRSANEAVFIAETLTRLTKKYGAPAVPYDLPFQNSKCIFYRYGSFDGKLELVNQDGARLSAIRNLRGELVADQREPRSAVPEWLEDPFPKPRRRLREASPACPLKTTIRAFEALSQRGKGGVYRALDLSVLPARLCVLKEGRRHGETDWDGRDGAWRVKHDGEVMAALSASGVAVPRVYLTFKSGPHYYLVTEFIEGENLQALCSKKRGKLSVTQALHFGKQIAETLAQIHVANWVWRDCKPLNLLVTKEGLLRPLDFEGACPIDQPDPLPWGTTGYVSAEAFKVPESGSRLPEDLYALGVTLQQLLSGQMPTAGEQSASVIRTSRRIPVRIRELISALLDSNPAARPSARAAAEILARTSSEMVRIKSSSRSAQRVTLASLTH